MDLNEQSGRDRKGDIAQKEDNTYDPLRERFNG